MSDYLTTLRHMYRSEVHRLTRDDDTVDRKTAIAYVSEAAQAMHHRGELEIDVMDIIQSSLVKIDEHDGAAADAAIESFAAGQYEFEYDGDPVLDVVVTLGRGRRKLWRDFTVDDLTELDRLRHRNVANVQAAYDKWRESFELLLPRLLAAGTMADLAAAGVAAA